MCYVYKYVLDGEIIYIGKGKNNRLAQHGGNNDNIDIAFRDEVNASDIYFIETPNDTMADVIESELIRRYKPKCNKAKTSDWVGLPFPEPAWTPFRISKEKQILTKREKEREEKRAKKHELEKEIATNGHILKLKEEIESLETQIKINETIISQMQKYVFDLTGRRISYKFTPGDSVKIIDEETGTNSEEIHTEKNIHSGAETDDSLSTFLKSIHQKINEL